jgi:hypothetical protein
MHPVHDVANPLPRAAGELTRLPHVVAKDEPTARALMVMTLISTRRSTAAEVEIDRRT